ncbi:MAG: NAD(P)/FAD-dependent oxidoreductase [Protaetiibacter sp.]
MTRPDVVIAGAGPSGMSAALTLARQGLAVRVLEATDGPSKLSHASTFHAPTVEILTELGVGEGLVEQGRVVRRLQYRDRTAGRLAEFDFGLLDQDTSCAFRLQAEQRVLTRLAYERLREFPNVEFRFNTPVDGAFTDGEEAVLVSSGREHRARWAIGADGANSAVRSALGIDFVGATYEMRYLTVMTSLDLEQVMPGIAPVTYVSGGQHGIGLLALPDHWRVAFRVPPSESKEEALDEGRVQQRMREALDIGVDEYPLVGRFIYFVHRRTADHLRSGKVFVIGDAAHVNSPSGGMGMNSGIHDAYVASSALVEIMAGNEPESLLDEMLAERLRVAREVIGARADQNYRDIIETDEAKRESRAEELARLEADPIEARRYLLRASMLDHAPRPGAPFATAGVS